MKARKLLWLLAVLAVVGYVACRKTDSRATEEPSPQVKESRFFGEHKSSNPQVQAIAGYLQRLNEKNGFAEKAVKKIGYPRWDKAMVFEKKTNQFIESEDSVIVTHIPFVRDSQNYVNASLVVRTSPNDTTLNYVCDWQYAQMPYGATNTDSSAENYAKYFMYMSKRTLGQSAFLITDTLLFSSSPRMHSYDRLKITILDNNAAGGMPETHTTLICYPVIHCGSPQYCAAQGGCDYQNCVQPGTCYMFYDCVPFYYGGSGGSGSGSGGDPGGDPGGGTGGGGGGSGSGSGVPPDCQGPIVPSGNLIETNATCTPGWEPILPIEPEAPDLTEAQVLALLVVSPPANQPQVGLNEFLKCFTNDPNSICKITIAAEQPVNGQSDCWGWDGNSVTVGHTFLTFEQTKSDGTKIIRSFGFYPEDDASPISPSSDGIIVDDSGEEYDASLTTTITPQVFSTVVNFLKTNATPPYNLSLYNCTTYAVNVLSLAGVSLPLGSCFWAANGNPGDLGQHIRNMSLASNQTRIVTTSNAPSNSGTCP